MQAQIIGGRCSVCTMGHDAMKEMIMQNKVTNSSTVPTYSFLQVTHKCGQHQKLNYPLKIDSTASQRAVFFTR